jgi:transposase-like protein
MKHTILPAGEHPQRHGSREQFWRQMLRQFAASDQSIREFCRSRALSEPSFYSWRRRLATHDESSAAMAHPSDAPAFVPIHITDQTSEGIEIVLRGDRRIRLSGQVDKAALAEVVAALESLPVAQESMR